MAQGDTIVFYDLPHKMAKGLHNLDTGGDVIKAALVTSVTTPTQASVDPNVGGAIGGGTDFGDNEVSGGSYAQITLAGQSLDSPGASISFDYDDIVFPADASGPTNARWIIVFNETETDNRALFAIDLGAVTSLQDGAITAQSPTGGVTINA